MNSNVQPIQESVAPCFRLGVRDSDGKTAIFALQHEEVQTFEQAIALTQDEFKNGTVLCLVPTTAGN